MSRPRTRPRPRFTAICLAAWVLAGAPAIGQAQTSSANEVGFSVERFVPAPGPGVFWTAERAEVLAHLQLSLGATGSLMSRPLVLQHVILGDEVTTPVQTRLGFDLLAAVGVANRFQLGLGFPVVAAQEGERLQGIDLDDTALRPVALGDLRLHAKARLVGKPGQPGRGVAVSCAVSIPTGDEAHFAGEKGTVVEWRLIGSWRWPGRGAVAANLGPRIRTEEVRLLSPARPHGNEIVGAFAGELIVPGLPRDQLSAVFEYAYVVGDKGYAGGVRGPSPKEVRFGGQWRLASGVLIGGALGFGTSPDEIGSPAWRIVGTARFDTAPTSDLDRDGIADSRDRCRARAEDMDGFEDTDGCPELDNDGDGIPDREDECPNETEDLDRHRDMDGCPDPDPGVRRSPVPDFVEEP